jgi:hypothetical protein
MTARKGAGPEAAATDLEAQKNLGNENARSSKPQPQNPQAAPKSWREVPPIRPAAELLPRMNADELRALGEDIKKSGLKIPVTAWFGKGEPLQLLDGRNRLDAMEAVDIPIKRLKMAPVHQGGRRHLSMGATVTPTIPQRRLQHPHRQGFSLPALRRGPLTTCGRASRSGRLKNDCQSRHRHD